MISITLMSCGQSKKYTPKPFGDNTSFEDSTDETDQYLVISAMKEYHPSVQHDSTHNLTEETTVAIPSTIKVTQGNAGNYYTLVTFDDNMICYYKGGSPFSYPLQSGNAQHIEDGKLYHFSHCSENGVTVNIQDNDLVTVSNNIKLKIHNGDSTVSTAVELSLQVQ